MEFAISLVVLVVFAVLMIGNALKTSRASRPTIESQRVNGKARSDRAVRQNAA
jgi:hypothetical protein